MTTMCALISELSHADLDDTRLETWSMKNIHWQRCWQSEKGADCRVMDVIGGLVKGEQVLATSHLSV